MQKRNATVAVIGAGDYIGGEIAKKFASEGFTVFAGRRDGAKLRPDRILAVVFNGHREYKSSYKSYGYHRYGMAATPAPAYR